MATIGVSSEKAANVCIVMILPLETDSIEYPVLLTTETANDYVGFNDSGLCRESAFIVMTVPDTRSVEIILVKVNTLLLPDVLIVGTVDPDEPESIAKE